MFGRALPALGVLRVCHAHATAVRALTLGVTILVQVGCAHASRSEADVLLARSATGPMTYVEVTNRNWEDLVVYLVRGSSRFTLGIVPGMSSLTLGIRNGLIGLGSSVRLLAGRRGVSPAFATLPFEAPPTGQRLGWTIEYHLPLSGVVVR